MYCQLLEEAKSQLAFAQAKLSRIRKIQNNEHYNYIKLVIKNTQEVLTSSQRAYKVDMLAVSENIFTIKAELSKIRMLLLRSSANFNKAQKHIDEAIKLTQGAVIHEQKR